MRYLYLFSFTLLFLIASCRKKQELKPDDFNNFWNQTLTELQKIPLEYEKVSDSIIEGKRLNLYKIRSFQNVYFYAWVSEPMEEGVFPVKIRFSGLGELNFDQHKIVHLWFLKQKGFINMLVDIRGQGLSNEQIMPKEYITHEIKNKENYIYRGAYMDAVRAVDLIAKNKKSNGKIIVTGGSQGGTLSVVAAALNKKVSLCVASFPFLTDIGNYDKKEWPMKIFLHKAKEDRIDYFDFKETLSYFDLLNFADMINVPVFIRTEEIDKITPSEGAFKLYNLIKNQEKIIYTEPCKGHGCSTNSKIANEMEKVFINDFLKSKEY